MSNNEKKNIPALAKQFMMEMKGNCAQAVFVTFVKEMELGNIDYETSMRIASTFGGGIAQSGNVCGACTGALMALGLKFGKLTMADQMKVTQLGSEFLHEFEIINDTTLCSKLIDHDSIGDMDIKAAFESGAFDKCVKYVEDASKILEKLLTRE